MLKKLQGRSMPSIEQWKKLYGLADEIKQIKPWKYLKEYEYFGVKDSKSTETAFVQVLGSEGEHFGVFIYDGLINLAKIYEYGEMSNPDPISIFDIPQLHLSFSEKEFLLPEELEIIKKLGLKFSGKDTWPSFRNVLPGCFPWLISEEEADFMITVYEQSIEVFKRLPGNPKLIDIDDDDKFLVRTKVDKGDTLQWIDEIVSLSFSDIPPFEILVEKSLAEKVLSVPKQDLILEVDLFNIYQPVLEEDKDKRPYFPKVLIIADHKKELILDFQIMKRSATDAEWNETVGSQFLNILIKKNIRPKQIIMKPDYLQIFDLISKILDFNVKINKNLTCIDQAIKSKEFRQFSRSPY